MPVKLLGQRQNCPAGRSFYVCWKPRFRGCCSVDACANDGCPDENDAIDAGDGRTETENADHAGESTSSSRGAAQASTSSQEQTTASRPTETPEPVALTSTDSIPPGSVHTTTVVSLGSAGTVTKTMVETEAASTQLAEVTTSSGAPNVGAIVGGVVGVVILLIVLSCLYACCWRRRQTRKRAASGSTNSGGAAYSGVQGDDLSPPADEQGLVFSIKRLLGRSPSKNQRSTVATDGGWHDKTAQYHCRTPSSTAVVSPLPVYTDDAANAFECEGSSGVEQLDSRPVSTVTELPGSAPTGLSKSAAEGRKEGSVELSDSDQNIRRSRLSQVLPPAITIAREDKAGDATRRTYLPGLGSPPGTPHAHTAGANDHPISSSPEANAMPRTLSANVATTDDSRK